MFIFSQISMKLRHEKLVNNMNFDFCVFKVLQCRDIDFGVIHHLHPYFVHARFNWLVLAFDA